MNRSTGLWFAQGQAEAVPYSAQLIRCDPRLISCQAQGVRLLRPGPAQTTLCTAQSAQASRETLSVRLAQVKALLNENEQLEAESAVVRGAGIALEGHVLLKGPMLQVLGEHALIDKAGTTLTWDEPSLTTLGAMQ